MAELDKLKSLLERKKGQRDGVVQRIAGTKQKIVLASRQLRREEKAREVIKEVGRQTQSQLSYNVAEITTMALRAVLKNPYDLELEFVDRRNNTECDIWFNRDNMQITPYDGGGGAVDVASFALRVASWSMNKPAMRNVLIMDEPFKNLKGEQANQRMLAMVKELSKRLGLQIIMVSDERVSRAATVEATDLLFEVSLNKDGVSIIDVE